MVELRNIYTQIKDGDWIESKDQSAEGIRLIQTGNIGIGTYLDKDNRAKFISEETFNELKCTEVFEGDILISRLPSPVGRACLVPKLDGRAITAVDCTILRVDRDICIPKYFVYYTMSDMYLNQIDRFVVGTTRARISRKNLEGIKIFLPEISKQKKIVEVLDKAQELIDKRKEQIEAMDELVKSRFIEMFGDPIINSKGWQTKNWNEILIIKNGKGQKSIEDKNGIYPICGSGGIMSYGNDYICNENTVIIGRKGNINKPILMREKFWNVDTAFGLEPNKKYINADYLYMFCEMYNFEKHNKAVTIPSLTKSDLLKIEMALPPIELQNQFADFVKQVDKLKSQMEISLKELEDNFNCLMQKAFKGELF